MSDQTNAAADLDTDTLAGDLRDALLTHVRAMEDPWSKLSEKKQREKVEAVETMAQDLVRRTVALIAGRGFENIRITLKDFQVKDGGIKGKFETPVTADTVVSLSDHANQRVTLVLADPSDFMDERGEAAVDPDEPALPMDEGADEGADDDAGEGDEDDGEDGSDEADVAAGPEPARQVGDIDIPEPPPHIVERMRAAGAKNPEGRRLVEATADAGA